MSFISLNIMLCLSVVIVSGAQWPAHLVRERRNEVAFNAQPNPLTYDYQIVPSSDYAVTSYQADESSILDLIFSPITAIMSIGSTALSVIHWTIVGSGLVLLGMAIVIGFCGLTSYCTITIENPFSRELSIPYLDDIQYYFNEAYNTYHEMQSIE